jgi:hypothetical protein
MIYISKVYGGPDVEGSRIDRVITQVMKLLGPGEEGPYGSLDIEMQVSGEFLRVEHTGIRQGRFSRKERMVCFQIGIDRDVCERDDVEIAEYLLHGLREAVVKAGILFRKAKVPYPEAEYLGQIDLIKQRLTM